MREEKRKTGDAAACTIDEIRPIIDNFQVSFSFNRLVADFRQNFGRQIFLPLAMATKMVAAWSAVKGFPSLN